MLGGALIGLGLMGCSNEDERPPPASGSGGSTNGLRPGGGGSSGAAGASSTGSCTPMPAQEPFGTNPDNGESFPDVQVADCEDATARITLDAIRCGHELTVVSIGAGWCEPCIEETPLLQEIHETLQPQGVQVVQVMFQNARGEPASTQFCQDWVEQFSLTMPVFIDPPGNTLEFFDVAVTPLNLILDEQGRVLWSTTGIVPDDLETTVRGFLDDGS